MRMLNYILLIKSVKEAKQNKCHSLRTHEAQVSFNLLEPVSYNFFREYISEENCPGSEGKLACRTQTRETL